MHDLGTAKKITSAVLERAEKRDAINIERIKISIGEMLLLNSEQVVFWIEKSLEGTIGEDADIDVDNVFPEIQCGCGYKGGLNVEERSHGVLRKMRCPECGSRDFDVIKGRECRIDSVDIEV